MSGPLQQKDPVCKVKGERRPSVHERNDSLGGKWRFHNEAGNKRQQIAWVIAAEEGVVNKSRASGLNTVSPTPEDPTDKPRVHLRVEGSEGLTHLG